MNQQPSFPHIRIGPSGYGDFSRPCQRHEKNQRKKDDGEAAELILPGDELKCQRDQESAERKCFIHVVGGKVARCER